MKINSSHGSGGKPTSELIDGIFKKNFSNKILDSMEDAAVLDISPCKIAFTTDSFVVTPLFFPGGDIGRLSVCGTVNDLLMRGAVPRYISCGFILEEGLDIEVLKKIAASMKDAAAESGVLIVTGDTKVIEGNGGVYINTSGIGTIENSLGIGVQKAVPNDAVIISGYMGNHHACILSHRMGIENSIESDCAPLCEMVMSLMGSGIEIHAMRDITRGGLATVLNEIAAGSRVGIELFDAAVTDSQVGGFCDILGLDPMYMGNEGKLVLTVPEQEADKALVVIRASKYGQNALSVGKVFESAAPIVVRKTRSGATRALGPLMSEGLPRIC